MTIEGYDTVADAFAGMAFGQRRRRRQQMTVELFDQVWKWCALRFGVSIRYIEREAPNGRWVAHGNGASIVLWDILRENHLT